MAGAGWPVSDASLSGVWPGHETNAPCTYWAKLAPGSFEQIVNTAVEMLGEMFEPPVVR